MLKGFVEVGKGAFKRLCDSLDTNYDEVQTSVYGPIQRMEFYTKSGELFGLIFFTNEGELRYLKEKLLVA